MARQQRFLEIIARNLANAETTRTAGGGPYRRQIAVTGQGGGEAAAPAAGAPASGAPPDSRTVDDESAATAATPPAAAAPPADGSMRVLEDPRPGRLVYDPGHPDANADGFVEYPNVDVSTELVDLMITRRIHEANASVFQAAKSMLKRALEI